MKVRDMRLMAREVDVKRIARSDLLFVKIPLLSQLDRPQQPQTNLTNQQASQRALTVQEIALRAAHSQGKLPKGYRFPLLVRVAGATLIFLVKKSEERDIIAHEINAVCMEQDSEI